MFFHSQVNNLIASQVHSGSTVVDIGASDLSTLVACKPRLAVGVDIAQGFTTHKSHENTKISFLEKAVEELSESPLPNPDFVVMSLVLDEVYDVQNVLNQANNWMSRDSRLVLVTYNRVWRPLIKLAELFRIKVASEQENYVPWRELDNFLSLAGFEVTNRLDGVLLPVYIPLISRFLNKWVSPLPLFRALSLVRVTVAEKKQLSLPSFNSVSVIIAARNEEGHIQELLRRIPLLAPKQEIIFVEGGSTDNTWQEIQKFVTPQDEITPTKVLAFKQAGKGKGDAVRKGFAEATGEVLMILDADISVPPEELPRFVKALQDGACDFANGSRLVYPMEKKAMRFLNILGNKFFGRTFSYLLGQNLSDTLCGTKVLRKSDYERISRDRQVFGDFDPFGDFDLLFGAARLNLKIQDVPVHYKERVYGETNISRFRHGIMLLRMCRVAALKLKFVG